MVTVEFDSMGEAVRLALVADEYVGGGLAVLLLDATDPRVSANLKSTTFANVSRRMRQRAFADPANVLSPTAQTELCSDRVSDPGGAG